ncbi:MAG: thiamine-phosphate kinase [Candidatus Micrarchaeota archaeon]
MRVSKLGEKKLIRQLTRSLPRTRSLLIGAGSDDAAVLRVNKTQLVLTSDIMFQQTHFPRALPPFNMGVKLATANLSDLAAMGATPLALLVSFGFPARFSVSSAKQIARGINDVCARYKCSYAGGDTKRSRELTISGFALGVLDGNALLQSNARAGDLVCTTGNIGSAACALHALINNKRASPKLLSSFLLPRAKIKEGKTLSKIPRCSAIDITDGLLFSASQLARSSRVKIAITENSIPVSKEARAYSKAHKLPKHYLLNTGEDYELLFTLPRLALKKISGKFRFSIIGSCVRGSCVYLDGKRVNEEGYDSLKKA